MVDIIDLFCGAGGLSLGAVQAGFTPRLAVDVDPVLGDGHRRNHPACKLLIGDLAQREALELKELSGAQGRLSGVIRGPPCQGFSSIGKRRSDDPRNMLLHRFFHLVEELKPKFFLMENVPGLLLDDGTRVLNTAISALKHPYVILDPIVLDAADYGAATTRKRLVVLGYDPSDIDRIQVADLLAAKSAVRYTVRDAIAGLPGPAVSDVLRIDQSGLDNPYVQMLNEYVRPELLCSPKEIDSRKELTSGFQLTRHTQEVVDRFAKVQPGGKDPVSRYVRLSWERPANVLRAGTGADRGSFQAARPIHPSEHRVITVREAARIQGFPDWYDFHGTKWHSHRMIGNSVSPPFARVLLSVVASRMDMGKQIC